VAANRVPLEVEIDVHVFAEPRRVVVPVGLRIAERLQYRVGLNEDVLHSATYDRFIVSSARYEKHKKFPRGRLHEILHVTSNVAQLGGLGWCLKMHQI
jgi:hypothetical protein